jgi:putative oligomerization/nucleic acid binding protein
MGIVEELAKLKALYESGALTDAEYAAAKAQVLAEGAEDETEASGVVAEMFGGRRRTLGEAANRYVSLQIVMAIVGVILFLIVASQMARM